MLFALLNNVPVIGHPAFRIVLGAALIAVGLALNLIYLDAVGAVLLVAGIARGAAALTSRTQQGHPR
jgi:uncharacterized membrane protein HdeD (DUF308 family)